jgi:hypothetical protein
MERAGVLTQPTKPCESKVMYTTMLIFDFYFVSFTGSAIFILLGR